MKIVHFCLDSPYNDYWGYQDNLLPKYQKKLGHDVTVVTTNTKHEKGRIVETECGEYILSDGVKIIRLDFANVGLPPFNVLKRKFEIFPILLEIQPDYIFFHGLINISFLQVIKYKKYINSQCIIVQDNHADYNIGRGTEGINNKVIRLYYRLLNKTTQKYVDKVYGVTPWRKQYAEDYYKINPQLTEVLLMGADDDAIDFRHRISIRNSVRYQCGCTDEEFVIVTGGKIDKKKHIDLLMKAVLGFNSVKLLIFGNVQEEMKNEFEKLLEKSKNIIYVGWIPANKVYDYFFAADLCFFPGQHSVLWEQACASKTPCVFMKWDGMEHVDNGGNADFIEKLSEDAIRKKIAELHFTPRYNQMKKIALSKATDIYLYSNIAKKSLEMCN